MILRSRPPNPLGTPSPLANMLTHATLVDMLTYVVLSVLLLVGGVSCDVQRLVTC